MFVTYITSKSGKKCLALCALTRSGIRKVLSFDLSTIICFIDFSELSKLESGQEDIIYI